MCSVLFSFFIQKNEENRFNTDIIKTHLSQII